jgi:hypothetical protein
VINEPYHFGCARMRPAVLTAVAALCCIAMAEQSLAQSDATAGVCYASTGGSSAKLLKIDLNTGAGTLIGSISPVVGKPHGLAINSLGHIYVVTTIQMYLILLRVGFIELMRLPGPAPWLAGPTRQFKGFRGRSLSTTLTPSTALVDIILLTTTQVSTL